MKKATFEKLKKSLEEAVAIESGRIGTGARHDS